jgi:insulysin
MISFFEHYISPTSTHRAKLSVHMLAQNSLPTPTAASSYPPNTSPPQEQKEKLFQILQQFLSSQEVLVDSDQLEKRLADMDVNSSDTKALLKAITAYLVTDIGVAPDKAKAVIEQGRSFLGAELGSIAMQPFTVSPGELANGVTMYVDQGPTDNLDMINGEPAVKGAADMVFKRENERVKIEDVHEWKAGLQVSAGPKPVRPLHEFEDLEAKL